MWKVALITALKVRSSYSEASDEELEDSFDLSDSSEESGAPSPDSSEASGGFLRSILPVEVDTGHLSEPGMVGTRTDETWKWDVFK